MRCRRVYNAYHHAFDTLRAMPPVQSAADNERLTQVLRRLVDEHGVTFPKVWPLGQPVHDLRAEMTPWLGLMHGRSCVSAGMLAGQIVQCFCLQP